MNDKPLVIKIERSNKETKIGRLRDYLMYSLMLISYLDVLIFNVVLITDTEVNQQRNYVPMETIICDVEDFFLLQILSS